MTQLISLILIISLRAIELLSTNRITSDWASLNMFSVLPSVKICTGYWISTHVKAKCKRDIELMSPLKSPHSRALNLESYNFKVVSPKSRPKSLSKRIKNQRILYVYYTSYNWKFWHLNAMNRAHTKRYVVTLSSILTYSVEGQPILVKLKTCILNSSKCQIAKKRMETLPWWPSGGSWCWPP